MGLYKKLVRDKIPEIIRKNGEEPVISILDDNEYKRELENKLQEECLEVVSTTISSERIEELADVVEVVIALAKAEGKSFEDVLTIAKKKGRREAAFLRKFI